MKKNLFGLTVALVIFVLCYIIDYYYHIPNFLAMLFISIGFFVGRDVYEETENQI